MLRVPSEISEQQFESLKLQDTMLVAYRNDVYPAKNDVFFEEHAVIYVLEGDKKFSSPTQEVHVRKGDVLFIQQGYYLMSESVNASYRSLVFFFNDRLLKDFAAFHAELFETQLIEKPRLTDNLLVLHTGQSFEKFIESLMPYFQGQMPLLNHFLRLKYQELLLHLLVHDANGTLHQFFTNLLKGRKVSIQFLMSKYALKPLSISELARLSGRSLSVFKRDFEKEMGTSPARWIKQKRMEQAYRLLKTSAKSVNEIALEVGYESVSHFIQAFKEKFGTTPKQLK